MMLRLRLPAHTNARCRGRDGISGPEIHRFTMCDTLLAQTEQACAARRTGPGFSKATFNKLLLNFTWWGNRQGRRFGKNVFEGGSSGLETSGVFDRAAPLTTAALEQADARPGWLCSDKKHGGNSR